eukprot:EG_transcript_3810
MIAVYNRSQEHWFVAVLQGCSLVHIYRFSCLERVFVFPEPVNQFAFGQDGLLVVLSSASQVFVVDPQQQQRFEVQNEHEEHPFDDCDALGVEVIKVCSSQAISIANDLPVVHLLLHHGPNLLAVGCCGDRLRWGWVRLPGCGTGPTPCVSFVDAGALQPGEVPTAALLSSGSEALSPLLQATLCDVGGGVLLVGTSQGRVLAVPLRDLGGLTPTEVSRLDGAVLCISGLKLDYSVPPPLNGMGDGHWNGVMFLTSEGNVLLHSSIHLRQYLLPIKVTAAVVHNTTLYVVSGNSLHVVPLQTEEVVWGTSSLPDAVGRANCIVEVAKAAVPDILVPRKWSLGPAPIRCCAVLSAVPEATLVFVTVGGELSAVPLAVAEGAQAQSGGPDLERELRHLLQDIQCLDAALQDVQVEVEGLTGELRQLSHAVELWQRHGASVERLVHVVWTLQHCAGAFASFEAVAGALHSTPAFAAARTGRVLFDLCLRLSNGSDLTFAMGWVLLLTFEPPDDSAPDPPALSAVRFPVPEQPQQRLSYSLPLTLAAHDACLVRVPIRGTFPGVCSWRCCLQLVYSSASGGLLRFKLAEHSFRALDLFVVEPQTDVRETGSAPSLPPGAPTATLLQRHNARQVAATPGCPHQPAPRPVAGYTQALPILLPTPTANYAELWSALFSHLTTGKEAAPCAGHNLLSPPEAYGAAVVLRSPLGAVVRARASALAQLPVDLALESSDPVACRAGQLSR